MAASITFNPLTTTNVGSGAFNITTDGYIQGMSLDNPSARFFLSGGFVASTETIPMYGGIAVAEYLPQYSTGSTLYPIPALGSSLARSTSVASTIPISGFTVFDQVHSGITTPQTTVPLTPTGGMMNFYRLGSGARIAVAADPTVASLQGGLISANVSWDFNANRLQPYVASGATESVTSMTWSSTNGGQVAVVVGSASIYAKVGDVIDVAGVTNTGTGAVALINTQQTINTWTDSTHFTFLLPGTSTLWGTFGGTIVLNTGIVALSSIGIEVLDVKIGGCMTVNYNASTGFATWNYNDSAAIILLQ